MFYFYCTAPNDWIFHCILLWNSVNLYHCLDLIWGVEVWYSITNCTVNILGCFILIQSINSLAPGRFEWNFWHVIFKQILVIDGWGISCEIALIWMSLDFPDDQSTLVQLMAWCHQATSHYLSQCWPRSLSPYGVTRPQWVKHRDCSVQLIPACNWGGRY